MATDDIGMDNLGVDTNEVVDPDTPGEQETNVDDLIGGGPEHTTDDLLGGSNDPNKSIAIMSGENPDFSPGDIQVRTFTNRMLEVGDVDRTTMADAPWKLRLLEDLETKEGILEKVYGAKIRDVYGDSAKKLLRSLRVSRGKNGVVTGLSFTDGTGAGSTYKSAVVGYSTGSPREAKNVPKAFSDLMKKVAVEYAGSSLGAEVSRVVDPGGPQVTTLADPDDDSDTSSVITEVWGGGGLATEDVISEVGSSMVDILDGEIRAVVEDIELQSVELRIPPGEMREIMGIVGSGILRQTGMTVVERIEALDIEIAYWEKKAEDEADPLTKRFYESVTRAGKLTKDYILVRNGLRPESDEALGVLKEVVEGSDELRLERFKRWAKENMIGLSAVAVSVAGLITGIVMAARGALKVGAKGLGRFAGAVGRVLKKLGPVFAALGSLVATALSWGSRGISWLANNLWFLAVVVAMALYGEYRRRSEAN